MAKRKSITGRKRKKARPKPSQVDERRVDIPADSNTFANAGDDHLQEPVPRQLLHLKNRRQQKRNASKNKPTCLTARVGHVSQNTIERKWSKLDDAAQYAIRQLMHSVHLPVLANFQSEQKKTEAQELLQYISASLVNRLPKTPFPRKTSGEDFDYERLSSSNTGLNERVVDATLAISTLKRDLESQKAALEAAEQEIEGLTDSVRSQEATLDGSHYVSLSSEAHGVDDLPAKINLVERHVH